MQKILVLVIILLGATGGIAAGFAYNVYLAPNSPSSDTQTAAPDQQETTEFEYLKLNNQFLVPLVRDNALTGMIALTMSLELTPGHMDVVYAQEPKIRDAFLQVLFDHANMGGFVGQFTKSSNLESLKRQLYDVGRKISGDSVQGVLITDIARQDL